MRELGITKFNTWILPHLFILHYTLYKLTMYRRKSVTLPDAFKLIDDIKLSLKPLDMSSKLKDYYVLRMLKELTLLFKTYKELIPYFRKELCLLRIAIKDYDNVGESGIKMEADNLKYRLDRVTNWKMAIIRKGQEILGKNIKLLFCCIDEGIRICVTDKPINMSLRINEARGLKHHVLEIYTMLQSNPESTHLMKNITEMVQGVILLLSLDGLTALKIRPEILNVIATINSDIDDPELEQKLNMLNEVIDSTMIIARRKRSIRSKKMALKTGRNLRNFGGGKWARHQSKKSLPPVNLGKPIFAPDSLKIAMRIETDIKNLEISPRLKDYIYRLVRDIQTLIQTHKELSPYFRKEMVQLKLSIKHLDERGDTDLRLKADLTKQRLDKVKAKKNILIKKENETQEERQKMFFTCIDEGIRIALTEKQINIAAHINAAKNIKREIWLIQKILQGSNVTPKTKKVLLEVTNEVTRMFAIDGLTAMKLKSDIHDIKDMVSRGKQAESDLDSKLKLLKVKVEKLSKESGTRRDETEKALNDIYRTMLYLDRQADLSTRTAIYLPNK